MTPALRSEFKRKCKDYTRDKSEITSLTALFEETPDTKDLPDDILWRALRFPLQWVQIHALYELLDRYRDPEWTPYRPSSPIHLSVCGNHSWDDSELAKGLSKHGIEIEPLHAGTTHLVLGINPPESITEYPIGITLLREEDVASLVIQHSDFYLLQGDREVEWGNLKSMLLASDKRSLELGMGILGQGGLPNALVTEVFTIYRSNLPFPTRQAARRLLLKFTHGAFKRNLLRKYFGFKGSDQQLIKTPRAESDPDHLLDLGRYLQLKIRFSPAGQANTENLVAFHEGLTNISGAKMLEVLESMQKDGRLRFPKTATILPSETFEMEHLKSIEVYHATIETLPPGIAKLPRLIRIWLNCPLTSLPDDLGASRSIRMVNLFNAQFEVFPSVLSDLPNLKIFRWEDCLAGENNTLAPPANFFRAPLNTLIIMEEKIQFPDTFYQLESLTSLALTYGSGLPLLAKIAAMPHLQRLRLAHQEHDPIDKALVLEQLVGWKLEDQNERNVSFIKA